MLARIEAKHFVAGLVLEADKVIIAAPIIRYMLGWSRERVREYAGEKGWRAQIIRGE